jgi:hypothetical protein
MSAGPEYARVNCPLLIEAVPGRTNSTLAIHPGFDKMFGKMAQLRMATATLRRADSFLNGTEDP